MKQLLVLTAMLALIGCDLTDDESIPKIASITPSNGATLVEKSAPIVVEFTEPMNTGSCQSRFHLHMDEITSMEEMTDGLSGNFSWNNGQTVMTFQPQSQLLGSSMYSICIQEGMMSSNQNCNVMMSGMMGWGNEVNGGIICVFTTK
ncbi:MAG: Ig-like domain-containing protein [Candidatus Marinimicrobia bacterium]|nr:Ig-like domain-containing protein [Candidatus Neomarinimicrobiota bacterium]